MKFRYLFAVAVMAFISSSLYAGATQPADVDVDLDNGFAGGDMVTARYSSDKNEFIGCGARHIDDGVGGVFSWAFCQAEDQDGDRAVCFTFNPAIVDAVSGISDSSYITFGFVDDGTGTGDLECTRIGFSSQSFYLPRGNNANGNNGNGNGGE